MKIKYRKPRPSPPKWYWPDSDYCWFCKNRSGYGGCKMLKKVVHKQKERRKNDPRQYANCAIIYFSFYLCYLAYYSGNHVYISDGN